MHSSLPLLALTLLGALGLPSIAVSQQIAPEIAPADSASAATSNTEMVAEVLLPTAWPAATSQPAAKILAGNVVDEWGNPLVGATVMLLGDQLHSVTTNSVGDYLLPTTQVAPVVRVSFAGYQDTERIARGPADLLFKLDPVQDYKRDLKKRSKAASKAWKR